MNKQDNYVKISPGTGGGEKTMKNSKLRMLLTSTMALFLMLLLSVGVQARIDCNLTVPTSNGVISKLTELNATFNTTLDGTTGNVSVAFEARVVSSIISGGGYDIANTSYVLIANVSNTSNRRHTNLTFGDQYIFGDGSYTLRATCYFNASSSGGPADATTTSSEVTATIDRSAPTCAFNSALLSSNQYAPSQRWAVTCQNASSATLKFGSNSPFTMVKSVDSCTFTGDKNKVPEGSYTTLVASVTDGYNTTLCQLTSIRIDSGVALKEIAAIVTSQSVARKAVESQQQSAGNGSSNSLVVIVIIGLAAYWYIRRKKDK